MEDNLIYDKLEEYICEAKKNANGEYEVMAACCVGDYNFGYITKYSQVQAWIITYPTVKSIITAVTPDTYGYGNYCVIDFRVFLKLLTTDVTAFEALVSPYRIVLDERFYKILEIAKGYYTSYKVIYIKTLLGSAALNIQTAKTGSSHDYQAIRCLRAVYYSELANRMLAYLTDAVCPFEDARKYASHYINFIDKENDSLEAKIDIIEDFINHLFLDYDELVVENKKNSSIIQTAISILDNWALDFSRNLLVDVLKGEI